MNRANLQLFVNAIPIFNYRILSTVNSFFSSTQQKDTAFKMNQDLFKKYLQDASSQFNSSKILEQIIPKKLQKQEDILLFTDNLEFSKDKNDLQSLNLSLCEPIHDLLDRGGKRWRPILCMWVAEAFGKNWVEVAEIAGLCEIVHNGTLMIDDIEDNSEVRRNKQCIHKIFGVDIAANAGNFMYFAPFLRLLKSPNYTDQQKLRFSHIFMEEMTALHLGQGWDILWHNTEKLNGRIPTQDQYLQMTSHKTGVLARLSTRLVCAALNLDQSSEKCLARFAERIGVAFQIQDDILNLVGDQYKQTKGYFGEDIHEGKMTLIVIHCINKSTPSDKSRLISILKSKTNDQKLIDEAINLLQKTKSIDYARQYSEKLITEAWEKDLDQLLPKSLAREKLKYLAEFTISRKL